MKYHSYLVASICIVFSLTYTHQEQLPTVRHTSIQVPIAIADGDFIHKDQLLICSDNPQLTISGWQSSVDAVTQYDPLFKEDKKVFDTSCILTIQVTHPADITDASIHVSYYRHATQAMEEQCIALSLLDNQSITPEAIAIDSNHAISLHEPELIDQTNNTVTNESFSCYVQQLVQKTDTIWLRIVLVLLLGLMMSLTPCIYPMIPITMGILQSQGSSSLWRNFLLASCYATGIATMFALLGLIAASTGQLFGAIMAHPVVIIGIVLILAYLALSMLGLYEMYVPRFMSNNNSRVNSGSFLSVFLFGFASGTVASPCLSPGLILLLTIVTSLKNRLLGFILLFSFGIGLSVPLLIIGTFSSALHTLPRAGMWMVEVKKLFGLIMIGMCFYFLNMVLPWHLLLLLITISNMVFGILYIYQARHNRGFIKKINTVIGIVLLASIFPLGLQSYKAYLSRNLCPISQDIWITDYHCAREKAIQEQKPLLMKVGGPCCSMCTAIDNKQFADTAVINTITEHYVPVKINGALMNEEIAHIKKSYTIHGFPTILIINPQTESTIKQWGSNLYDVDQKDFVNELLTHVQSVKQ